MSVDTPRMGMCTPCPTNTEACFSVKWEGIGRTLLLELRGDTPRGIQLMLLDSLRGIQGVGISCWSWRDWSGRGGGVACNALHYTATGS